MPLPNSEVIKRGTQKINLIKEVTGEEILNAIKDMPSEKSPGVDSVPIEFYTSQ